MFPDIRSTFLPSLLLNDEDEDVDEDEDEDDAIAETKNAKIKNSFNIVMSSCADIKVTFRSVKKS